MNIYCVSPSLFPNHFGLFRTVFPMSCNTIEYLVYPFSAIICVFDVASKFISQEMRISFVKNAFSCGNNFLSWTLCVYMCAASLCLSQPANFQIPFRNVRCKNVLWRFMFGCWWHFGYDCLLLIKYICSACITSMSCMYWLHFQFAIAKQEQQRINHQSIWFVSIHFVLNMFIEKKRKKQHRRILFHQKLVFFGLLEK